MKKVYGFIYVVSILLIIIFYLKLDSIRNINYEINSFKESNKNHDNQQKYKSKSNPKKIIHHSKTVIRKIDCKYINNYNKYILGREKSYLEYPTISSSTPLWYQVSNIYITESKTENNKIECSIDLINIEFGY